MWPRAIAVSFVLGALSAPAGAHAQTAAGDPAPGTTTLEPPASVPPVMVVVLGGERVSDDLLAAVRAALVAQVLPMAGGRPVLPLTDATLIDALAACGDDPACVGRLIAGAGAMGAVIARVSRTRRAGPVTASLELVDPVSGSARLPASSVVLSEGEDPASILLPRTEAFRAVMFSPPPAPPRLLVTTNVDGATVLVDGVSVGTAPLARLTLEPGRHTVTVTAAGYAASSRDVDLGAGDERRIDVLLGESTATSSRERGPLDEVVVGTATSRAPEVYQEWWFWTIIGGGVAIAIGVGVGVGVASSGPPPAIPDPMGIRLPEIR